MAGAGKKTFTAGETLTASDVNNYLMDQSVMVFGGTAARSSAVPTPSEGMFAVTTDTDELDYYDGSSWVPALPVGAWQSWAPTLSGGWLNGNGTWEAFYTQIGKTVHVDAAFTLGSTTTKGTTLTMSLPVTAKRPGTNTSRTIGNAIAFLGSGFHALTMLQNATTTVTLYAINSGSAYAQAASITTAIPATWVTGDRLHVSLTYEAA